MATDTMTTAFIEANSKILGLEIRPDWMPNVVKFVDVARDMADLVQADGVLETHESAPIFTLRDVE